MCQMLLQLRDGILKCHHILMDVIAQLQDLLFAVQNLNTLCVWVVTGAEWTRDSGCIGSGRNIERGNGGEGTWWGLQKHHVSWAVWGKEETDFIFSWAFLKLSARKYTGCISVWGNGWTAAFMGSKGRISGLLVRQYCKEEQKGPLAH